MTPSPDEPIPWDQRVARRVAPLLARTGLHPNTVTVLSLALALGGAALMGRGTPSALGWGATIFALARFLDHFDGELARASGQTSRLGYYLDYASGAVSYGALFWGLALAHAPTLGPLWAWGLGGAGVLSSLLSMFLNLDLDRASGLGDGEAIGYPGVSGFELEDGIYLIVPIAWAGWTTPFFVAAGVGAALYCLWTGALLLRVRSRATAGMPSGGRER